MPYILLHLNSRCHFHCFRIHIYNTLQENVLLASMLGIMQLYSVDIFSSFDVLRSRWCSVVCLMCFLEAWLIYFVIELPADHVGVWSHFARYCTKASWKSVSAPGNLQFYHYIFRKNWKYDVFLGKQGQGNQSYIFVEVCTVSFIFHFLSSLRKSDCMYHNGSKEETLEQNRCYHPHADMAFHFPQKNSYNLPLGKRLQILASTAVLSGRLFRAAFNPVQKFWGFLVSEDAAKASCCPRHGKP